MAERLAALVVHADVAPEGGFRLWRGEVQVMVGLGGRPTVLARKFRMDDKRWLVPGTEITIEVDPAKPDHFEIDWEAIPSIEDRVARNDPTLVDPVAARQRAAQALGRPPTPPSGRFEEAMAHASATPAPSGKIRAVVRVATMRGNLQGDQDGRGERVTMTGTSAAVLSVNIPGRSPYAVFHRKFKLPRGRVELTGAGLPALVDIGDPNDVTILWDELPAAVNQVQQRMTDAMARAQAAPQTMPQYADPAFQQTMVEGARRALAQITDPAQRKAMIDGYRAAGINVEDD